MMGESGATTLVRLIADPALPARGRLPERLADDLEPIPAPVAERRLRLDANTGSMQMLRRAVGRGTVMAINDEPYV